MEKEFLIRQYRSNPHIKMRDFCEANHISDGAFKKWLKQYEEGGLEGLARADAEIGEVLPEGSMGELVFTAIDKEAFPMIR